VASCFTTCADCSDGFDPNGLARHLYDLVDVRFVRSDNDVVVAARCAFNNGDVDNVSMIGSASKLADSARLIDGHVLDLATGQHASQAGLARSASPCLGDHWGRDIRYDLLGDESNMERPHAPVVTIPGYERTSVVGNPCH
jgi:hypothetical protein